MYASENNDIFSIFFLYILVIVYANLTSNAVIFKRIADMSLLIDFSNDYRTYLFRQVSRILFSIIISSFDFNLFKSLISISTMRPAYGGNLSIHHHNFSDYI